MRVSVTIEMVDLLGATINAEDCPIARACRRLGLGPVAVGLRVLTVAKEVLYLPPAALGFRRDFDAHNIDLQTYEPVTFELELPDA